MGLAAAPTFKWVGGGSFGEPGKQVAQGPPLGHREPGGRREALFGADLHPLTEPAASGGDHQALDAPVVGVGLAANESLLFEMVGDQGAVGGVADKTVRELAHRSRGVQDEQGPGLDVGKAELLGDGVEVGPHPVREPPDELDELLQQRVGVLGHVLLDGRGRPLNLSRNAR